MPGLCIITTSHHYQGQSGPAGSECFVQLDSIHFWHVDIQQEADIGCGHFAASRRAGRSKVRALTPAERIRVASERSNRESSSTTRTVLRSLFLVFAFIWIGKRPCPHSTDYGLAKQQTFTPPIKFRSYSNRRFTDSRSRGIRPFRPLSFPSSNSSDDGSAAL